MRTPNDYLKGIVHPMKIRTPRASGITLIEMLVVMVLLSLAAAFVGPAVGSGLDGMALRSTGRRLVSVFRQAQAEARMSQETMAARVESGQVSFLTTADSIRTVELNSTIRIGDGQASTYLFLGSGHILGPERLEIQHENGRSAAIVLGPSPGRVRFVEEDR